MCGVVMATDLLELLDRLPNPAMLVIGDVILDRYIWGDAERISQEAPVILLRADQREQRLGGAASVATMLRALGCEVALAGVVGADSNAPAVRELCRQWDIQQRLVLTDPGRPTTVKERYVGRAQQRHPQQMIRVDYEARHPLAPDLEEQLIRHMEELLDWCEIVLISDYDKGVCTPELLRQVLDRAQRAGKRVLVDPIRCSPGASPHPWRKYCGAAALTPNRLEASLASGLPIRQPEEALAAGEALCRDFDLEAAIVTLDKDGMALVHRDGRRRLFPTRPRQVYDITGAGDMVLSVLGMALAAGANYEDAIRLANVAGGLEVEKIGVVPVTRDEIRLDLLNHAHAAMSLGQYKLVSLEMLLPLLSARRAQGQQIVFTNGCFDLLHAGHVQYLREAKSQGDILVVGLNSDDSVRRLKGPTRPVNTQHDRAMVLAGLADVDYVIVFEEETPRRLIEAIRPDVLVKGADYRADEVVGADIVTRYGGRVHLASLKPGLSTSILVQRLLQGEASLRRRQVA
jgi:D-beta-D-heptose 7-phosphate kinase/D-beta-D-heptose 1-phosphate adenosyltransferase